MLHNIWGGSGPAGSGETNLRKNVCAPIRLILSGDVPLSCVWGRNLISLRFDLPRGRELLKTPDRELWEQGEGAQEGKEGGEK